MHGDWPLTSPPGCAQSVAGPVSAVLRARGALVGNDAQLVGATDERSAPPTPRSRRSTGVDE